MRRATLALLAVLALPALGQLTSASLTGRVTVSGAPAAGVTVTLTSNVLQHPRSTVTGARGTYWMEALPHGTYDVTFSRAGLTSLTRRAVLQTARTARADARLEPSEDEETVTSTATTPTVVDTIAITSHFDADTLERLPLRREVHAVAAIAPPISSLLFPRTDDAYFDTGLIPHDALDEVTVVRDAVPVEFSGPTIVARTRAPRQRLFLALRDTLTSAEWIPERFRGGREGGVEHHVDLTAGGGVVPERLWFFGAGWLGDEADVIREEQRGVLLKLTGSLTPAHSVTASYIDAQSRFFSVTRESVTNTTLRYSGVAGPRVTTEAQVSRVPTYNPGGGSRHAELVDARASFVAGEHVLTGGGNVLHLPGPDLWSLFASDRWMVNRWTIYAGLRHEENSIESTSLPRLAVAHDVRGNARHALHASWGRYQLFRDLWDVATLGYAYAFAANGYARVDLVRRAGSAHESREAHLEGRYRLFDRFEVGGSYAYLDPTLFDAIQKADAWAAVEVPLGEHELGFTVLQHLVHGGATLAPTDFALRYSFPLSRARLTLAADWSSLLTPIRDDEDDVHVLRFWIRVSS